MRMRRGPIIGAAFAALIFVSDARAEQIVVSSYGIAANGMPYAIAMEKGFFKEEGADVTGILSSNGGGTTIRNLLGGNLNYGEVDLAGSVAAIEQGNDLHIISDNVLTVGEFVWSLVSDTSPNEAGGVSGGLFNTFGNLSSITTPIIIGYIVAATGSFSGALVFVGSNALVAAFAYLVIVGKIERVQLRKL